MDRIDENLERLIVRELDGELTEQERHELNKLLIRLPQAASLLEEYRRNDALAAAAVRQEIDQSRDGGDVSWTRPRRGQGRAPAVRAWWTRLPVRVALAACVGLAAVGLALHMTKERTASRRLDVSRPIARNGRFPPGKGQPGVIGPARLGLQDSRELDVPRFREHRVWRDVLVVPSDDRDELFLLEFNRTRTQVVPVCEEL